MYSPHKKGGPVSTAKLLQKWNHCDDFYQKAIKLDIVGNRIDKALELEKRIAELEKLLKEKD